MSKQIIAIGKDKIITALVTPGNKDPVRTTGEYGWSQATLDMVFLEIAKKSDSKHYRILITDELSYVVRLAIPLSTKPEEEREVIFPLLQEKIPENLTNSQWDYKEVGVTKEDGQEKKKDVVAFALVNGMLPLLTNASFKAGFVIEAIEPETISKIRSANPLVGLALKDDISGEDKNVLNLKPEGSSTNNIGNPVQDSPNLDPDPVHGNKKRLKLLLWLVPISLVAIGLWIFRNNLPFRVETDFKYPLTTLTVTPGVSSVTPTVSVSPSGISNTPLDKGAIKIQVQNGSGLKGEADNVKTLLEKSGFTSIITDNADSYEYTDTQVILKEGTQFEVFSQIRQVLTDNYSVIESKSKLPDTSQYDVTIIVGKIKK